MCQPTGQRPRELEKIELAAIDPLGITTADTARVAHCSPKPLALCNAPANTAAPWECCARRTLLSFAEAWFL